MPKKSISGDQARERQAAFGRGFSSLSSADFADEAPPPPNRDLTGSSRNSSSRMSSRVVKYSSNDNDGGMAMISKDTVQDDDEKSTESNSFLKRFLLRSPLPKHRVPIDSSPRRTVEYPSQTKGEKIPLLVHDGDRGSSNLVRLSEFWMSEESQAQAVSMASIFLTDYERARPPTLPVDLHSISSTILRVHKVRYCRVWRILIKLAFSLFFVASCLEGEPNLLLPFLMNTFAILVFTSDIILQRNLGLPSGPWTVPMIVMMAALFAEMLIITVFPGTRTRFLFASIPKPLALFYCSEKARNALEALGRIAPIVTRVLALELLLILSFAAVACRLYSEFDSFHNLSTAWLSLFQLSTTVVNPSMWMPVYNVSRQSAFFFVTFDIATTLYLHSLVLSVVFQTYIQASTEIHDRSISDREESIRLAFIALQDPADQEGAVRKVRTESLRKVLQVIRPHYNAMKINALVEILDPADVQSIDFPTFRNKIRQSLNASIRSAPSRNLFAYAVEITAAVVAISNFIYVILLTSQFEAYWFDVITLPAGLVITMLGLFELIARANPFHWFNYTPTTRLNPTFDGLAALAAGVSCWGLLHYDYQLELMLTGRAIDMIRIMRFQRIFRDVVRRSGEVIPALAGPLVLVVSTNHLFVYLGMAIWGGAIKVGAHEDILTPLYDLNNFNSYWEGLVTMFQVLIINDWHAIAEVYLYATKHSSPYIVYPFFVGGNLISVSIMLNCLTAFFVGAFVTKLENGSVDDQEEVAVTVQREREFVIDTSGQSVRKVLSMGVLDRSVHSEKSEQFEYDVFEREGFDQIMKTVAGGSDDADVYAKEVCDMLEIFERLCPGRSKLGYLVCCQQTMNRFGNRRFQSLAEDFMEVNQLHALVSNMHAELILVTNREKSITREVVKDGQRLCLSASLLRQHPAISLFVSVKEKSESSRDETAAPSF